MLFEDFNETSLESSKLPVTPVTYTELVPDVANSMTIDSLTGLKLVVEELRTVVSTKDEATRNSINSIIDTLELRMQSLATETKSYVDTNVATLNDTVTNAIGADITKLTTFANNLKQFLNDGDATNTFNSMAEEINTLVAGHNKLLSYVPVNKGLILPIAECTNYFTSGYVSLPVEVGKQKKITGLIIKCGSTSFQQSSLPYLSFLYINGSFRLIDNRYPLPKLFKESKIEGLDITEFSIVYTENIIPDQTPLGIFDTAVPTLETAPTAP
jgi:hypothetical protein